jgi:hypothetical protein
MWTWSMFLVYSKMFIQSANLCLLIGEQILFTFLIIIECYLLVSVVWAYIFQFHMSTIYSFLSPTCLSNLLVGWVEHMWFFSKYMFIYSAHEIYSFLSPLSFHFCDCLSSSYRNSIPLCLFFSAGLVIMNWFRLCLSWKVLFFGQFWRITLLSIVLLTGSFFHNFKYIILCFTGF